MIIMVIALTVMLVTSSSIYLLRKDIFVNRLKLYIGARGINLDISTKEKSGPPWKDDHFNQN